MILGSKIYEVSNKQYTLKIPSKLKGNYLLLDAIKIDNSYVGLVTHNSIIHQIDQSGEIRLRHSMDANSSNLVSLSSTSMCYFSANKNRIVVINLLSLQVQQREIDIEPKFARNQFQLFYFRQMQLFALLEKNDQQNKLSINYLRQQNESFSTILNFSTDEQWNKEQKIYKINEYGLIGWPTIYDGILNINLFSVNEGYKAMQLQFKVLSTTQIGIIANYDSDNLHIGLFNQNATSIPILVVETQNNFSVNKKERVIQNNGDRNFGQIKEIYSLGSFIVFKGIVEENAKIFIYSLQTFTIVQSYFLKEKQSTLIESFISKGTLIQTSNQSNQELSFIVHEIRRQNNVEVMKLLEAHSKVNKIAETKDKAVLFFGRSGSGRTTYIAYLCQKQLQHIYHEDLAYFELRLKQKVQKQKSEVNSHQCIQIQQNKLGALIKIPNWNQSQEKYVQLQLLMQEVLKNFQSIHLVVTIPYQQIQMPETYQKTIESMIHLIQTSNVTLKDKQIGDTMSILLTKIEDSEAHELFQDHIQLVKEQNEKVGSLLQRVNEKQRVLLFQNKSYKTQQGEQASNSLFNSDMLVVDQKICLESKNNLVQSSQGKNIKETLLLQLNLYSSLLNKILLYIAHLTVQVPTVFNQEVFQEHNYHLKHPFTKLNLQNKDKSPLIYSFFMALSELKIIVQKKKNSFLQRIPHLQKYFQALRKEYKKLNNQEDCELFRVAFNSFTSSVMLLLDYFPEQNLQIFEKAIYSLKSEPNGVLGKTFKPIIQKLSQTQLVSTQKSILKELYQYLGQPSGKPRVRIVKKQLNYQQEKEVYLRDKKGILQTICSLPANAMKLDLIFEQIAQYIKKQQINDQNIREVRFYLREASRICHFHQLYQEAIILLMVIPDFIGIQVLLDQMVQSCKRKNPIESKKLFNDGQQQIIDELIVICRQCLRDSLVCKLIYIKSLNKQINSRQNNIKRLESISLKNQLSKPDSIEKYQQKLSKKELIFYNFQNATFKDLIDKKKIDVVKKCIIYQEQSERYSSIQALNWVIQTIPIPGLV